MNLKPMYNGIPFSPQTELASGITAAATTIPVVDISVFPDAPNYATIGYDENAETVLYTDVSGNALTGVTRGIEGTARVWASGEVIGRNFTNEDYSKLTNNIEEISKEVVPPNGTTAQYLRGDKSWADFGTSARSTALTGLTAQNEAITATDSVLAAMGKAQGQIGANLTRSIEFLVDIEITTQSAIPMFSVPTPGLHLVFDVYATRQTNSNTALFGLLGTAVFKFLTDGNPTEEIIFLPSALNVRYRHIGYRIENNRLYVYLLTNNGHNKVSVEIRSATRYISVAEPIRRATFSEITEEAHTILPYTEDITRMTSLNVIPPDGTTAQYLRGDKSWADFGASARGTALTGLTPQNEAITAADSVLAAMGKAQGQITQRVPLIPTGSGIMDIGSSAVNFRNIYANRYLVRPEVLDLTHLDSNLAYPVQFNEYLDIFIYRPAGRDISGSASLSLWIKCIASYYGVRSPYYKIIKNQSSFTYPNVQKIISHFQYGNIYIYLQGGYSYLLYNNTTHSHISPLIITSPITLPFVGDTIIEPEPITNPIKNGVYQGISGNIHLSGFRTSGFFRPKVSWMSGSYTGALNEFIFAQINAVGAYRVTAVTSGTNGIGVFSWEIYNGSNVTNARILNSAGTLNQPSNVTLHWCRITAANIMLKVTASNPNIGVATNSMEVVVEPLDNKTSDAHIVLNPTDTPTTWVDITEEIATDDGVWHDMVLQNGATAQFARYRKIGNIVFVNARIYTTEFGRTIFSVLPAQFRPSEVVYGLTLPFQGAATNPSTIRHFSIGTTGSLALEDTPNSAAPPSTGYYINFSFIADA